MSHVACSPQNGRAERNNQTITKLARTLLLDSKQPRYLWPQACACAVYVLNIVNVCPQTNKSAYEMIYKVKPKISHLRPFGSPCFVYNEGETDKFLRRGIPAILVGFTDRVDGFSVLIPGSPPVIRESKDVRFLGKTPTGVAHVRGTGTAALANDHENDMDALDICSDSDGVDDLDVPDEDPSLPRASDSAEESEPGPSVPAASTPLEPLNLRRTHRKSRKPLRYDDVFEAEASLAEPQTLSQALSSPEAEHWKASMDAEIQALQDLNVWRMVNLPPGRKPISCRWVFRRKTNANNEVERYRSRLVVRGFNQREGIDYQELFSPTARMDTIRVLLAISASKRLKLRQFDVVTAFLHGDLDEEIFMTQPPGYADGTNKVCLLQKSLYGLKQSPRCWNQKLSGILKKLNFKQTQADNCLYSWHGPNGQIVFLAIYVDDGIIAATHDKLIESTLTQLGKHFTLKSSPLNLFLGLHVHVDKDHNIWINQYKYIKTIIKRFELENCRTLSVPADTSIYDIPPQNGPRKQERPYRHLLGSLLWCAICSRPDICFAVGYLSRFMENYSEQHWQAGLKVLRYLQGTADLSIRYSGAAAPPLAETLQIYSDADFAACKITRRSVSGSIALLAGGPVLWASQQQRSVTLSSTEAEFFALTDCSKNALWLRTLFEELRLKINPVVFCDNKSSLALVHNPLFHKRTKHCQIRFLYVRELAERKQVEYQFVSSGDNLSDTLTKPLAKAQFERLRSLIGLLPWPLKQQFS